MTKALLRPYFQLLFLLSLSTALVLAACQTPRGSGDDDDDDDSAASGDDDDSSAGTGDDDDTGGSGDDDDTGGGGDDDDTGGGGDDDDAGGGDDDDDDGQEDCDNPITGNIELDSSLGATTNGVDLSTFVFESGSYSSEGFPQGSPAHSTTVPFSGSFPVNLEACGSIGTVAVVVFLDMSEDNKPCTEGDFHGFTVLDVAAGGTTDATVTLSRVLEEGDCGH